MIDEINGEVNPEDIAHRKFAIQGLIEVLRKFQQEVGPELFGKEVAVVKLCSFVQRSDLYPKYHCGTDAVVEVTGECPDGDEDIRCIPSIQLKKAQRALKLLEEKALQVATAA